MKYWQAKYYTLRDVESTSKKREENKKGWWIFICGIDVAGHILAKFQTKVNKFYDHT